MLKMVNRVLVVVTMVITMVSCSEDETIQLTPLVEVQPTLLEETDIFASITDKGVVYYKNKLYTGKYKYDPKFGGVIVSTYVDGLRKGESIQYRYGDVGIYTVSNYKDHNQLEPLLVRYHNDLVTRKWVDYGEDWKEVAFEMDGFTFLCNGETFIKDGADFNTIMLTEDNNWSMNFTTKYNKDTNQKQILQSGLPYYGRVISKNLYKGTWLILDSDYINGCEVVRRLHAVNMNEPLGGDRVRTKLLDPVDYDYCEDSDI